MMCMIDIDYWGISQDALNPLISSRLVLLQVNDDKIYFDYYQCFSDFVPPTNTPHNTFQPNQTLPHACIFLG